MGLYLNPSNETFAQLVKSNRYVDKTGLIAYMNGQIGQERKSVRCVRIARCKVDIGAFQNDMTTFHSSDDILTLLIHLGYLAYDSRTQETFVPNEEVRSTFFCRYGFYTETTFQETSAIGGVEMGQECRGCGSSD